MGNTLRKESQETPETISDETFFYKYVLPYLRRYYPTEHYSYWMFSNIARMETGIDKRRTKLRPEIADIARQIYDLFKQAKESLGKPELKTNLQALVGRLRKWYDEESVRGLTQRKELRKIDYDLLKEALPNLKMTPKYIKDLAAKVSPQDNAYRAEQKREFQEAYVEFYNQKDSSRLQNWDNENQWFLQNRDMLISAWELVKEELPIVQFNWYDFLAKITGYSKSLDTELRQAVEMQDPEAIISIIKIKYTNLQMMEEDTPEQPMATPAPVSPLQPTGTDTNVPVTPESRVAMKRLYP